MSEAREDDLVCAACLNARERYLHRLKHDVADLVLDVGRVCAERLEGDPYGPEKRERVFRDDLRLIRDWPKRRWHISAQGNPYLNSRGYNVSIWPKGPGFGITLKVQNKFEREFVQNGRLHFQTIDDAKRGALEAVLYARQKLR